MIKKEKKGSLFGMIGVVLFLIVVFVILGLTLFQSLSLGAIGHMPKMHIHATIQSSDYSNDCDIFLMNLLRFEAYPGTSGSPTFSQVMGLAKQRKQGQSLGTEMKRVIEQEILALPAGEHLDCFEIKARGPEDKEYFLDYSPYGPCEEKTSSKFCEAYVPDSSPERGYIKVEMAVEYNE